MVAQTSRAQFSLLWLKLVYVVYWDNQYHLEKL